jgi:ABC-type enterobactin transport system permease subunit
MMAYPLELAAEVFGFWDFNNYLATPFGLVTGLAWGLFTMPLLHQKMRIKQV